MFIKKLVLKNFKRFTDVTFDLSERIIPPKLVLLVGSNGSGKSSVFDAFEALSFFSKNYTSGRQDPVIVNSYKKDDVGKHNFFSIEAEMYSGEVYTRSDNALESNYPLSHTFYGRSSNRNLEYIDPSPDTRNFRFDFESDTDRPKTFSSADNRFTNDLKSLAGQISKLQNGKKIVAANIIEPINKYLKKIFLDETTPYFLLKGLEYNYTANNIEIKFIKGKYEIAYEFLSIGEKEIFGLILNLFLRRKYYENAVFYFDEIDTHISYSAQRNLIKLLTEELINNDSQLWLATHSLAFIDYASSLSNSAILNLNNIDFDSYQHVKPEYNLSQTIFTVSAPAEVIFKFINDTKVVFCENKNCIAYNSLRLEGYTFVGVNNSEQVYFQTISNSTCLGIRDKDFLTSTEVNQLKLQYKNYKILPYYTFENLLYHPENIIEYLPNFDIEEYKKDLLNQKNQQKDKIIASVLQSRRHYKENVKDELPQELIDYLNSDEFEKFYIYFNWKRYNKTVLNKYTKLHPDRLRETKWFNARINEILEG